jgi:hypothetical protein
MTRRQIRILLAASVWTLYVWVSRLFIMAGQDTSTGFKVVHFVLAGVSIAFGVAVGWIAWSARRQLHQPGPRSGGTDGQPVISRAQARAGGGR